MKMSLEARPGNIFKKQRWQMILRKMMKKYVPEEITQAEKGFSSPDASWFKGDSIEYVKKSILNQKSIIYDYLDFDGVGKLVSEHLV